MYHHSSAGPGLSQIAGMSLRASAMPNFFLRKKEDTIWLSKLKLFIYQKCSSIVCESLPYKIATTSVPNYSSFDFFDLKFAHLSYSKICAKYHFFCCGLLYQYKIFKNDLILVMFAQSFWIRRVVKLGVIKVANWDRYGFFWRSNEFPSVSSCNNIRLL